MPSILESSPDITQSHERSNLVEAKVAFENFVDDLELQYPNSRMLRALVKAYDRLHADLELIIEEATEIYRLQVTLSGWYTAQRSVLICVCEHNVTDTLSGPDSLRPQFEEKMGTYAASRLKHLLNGLMVASNAAREKTIRDMTSGLSGNAIANSALHFHRVKATAIISDEVALEIRYRLYGTSCISREDSCYTSCSVWEPSFDFVTHRDIDATWLMPSQNLFRTSASNEVQELDTVQAHGTPLDVGAAPYILAICKAAWTTFGSESEQLDNSAFFDSSFSESMLTGVPSLADAESNLISNLKDWQARQQE